MNCCWVVFCVKNEVWQEACNVTNRDTRFRILAIEINLNCWQIDLWLVSNGLTCFHHFEACAINKQLILEKASRSWPLIPPLGLYQTFLTQTLQNIFNLTVFTFGLFDPFSATYILQMHTSISKFSSHLILIYNKKRKLDCHKTNLKNPVFKYIIEASLLLWCHVASKIFCQSSKYQMINQGWSWSDLGSDGVGGETTK